MRPLSVSISGGRIVRGDRAVVDDVSVDLEPGRLTAILGPNGAGKTTLLRGLIGLVPLAAGRVEIGGRPLSDLSRKEIARRISYLPQSIEASIELRVEQTVWMGRYPHLPRMGSPGAEDHAAVHAALERAGVRHLRHRRLDELSGGERQRVLLARSFATQASTWLLDEPTASLDIPHALDILDLLRQEAAEGRTLAVTLHDLNLALRFCDRFVLLREGRLIASGDAHSAMRPDLLQTVFDARFHLHVIEGIPHLVADTSTAAKRPALVRERPSTASAR